MNHSSRLSFHGYVPFQLTLGNGLLHSINSKNINQYEKIGHESKSDETIRDIDTEISYLSIPEPQLHLVKPQQFSSVKHQIQEDFHIRYQYISNEELNKMFSNLDEIDIHRCINSYHSLYKTLLELILKNVDMNEEISQLKHLILYENEIFPILIHNHKLANEEKKILYNIITKTWQNFDDHIQKEINARNQIEQIKIEHQHLIKMKIKQEQYQTFYLKVHEMNNDIIHLKREIPELYNYKHELENEIHNIKIIYSQNLNYLDHIKTTRIRSHINELNNLQLERDSLITQTELIKYNLFEQIQEYDHILKNYRTGLNTYRLTLTQLEQELKQQTDNELIHLQMLNKFSRQSISDDTLKLINILENKNREKNLLNIQLQKSIEIFQEKISKQKQLLAKKQYDYQTMENLEQELNQNLSIYRDSYHHLKIERRTNENQFKLKSKQFSTDENVYHALIQQHESLLAQKRLEILRVNTSNERIESLTDENQRLKTSLEHLYHESTKINPNNLINLKQTVFHLKQIHQNFLQEKIFDQYTKTNSHLIHQQLQIKNEKILNRINHILKRIHQYEFDFNENSKHIQTLENKLSEEQQYYLQSKYFLTEMKNQSESNKNKQNRIEIQTQVVSNNIKYSQYNLKTFTQQLFLCQNDLTEQKISLKKLYEFYSVLKQQDEMNLKKLTTINNQITDYENRYKFSQKSLQQTKNDLTKYIKTRSILGRMVVRRVNLCQLLYKKLARFDQHIHQRQQNIEIISQCIKSLISQIQQMREQNKKILEKNDHVQFETLKIHTNKMLDHSHEKQRLLNKKIFQRRFYIKHSPDPLPYEEINYLKRKYYILKNRLIKIICRGIICNLVYLSIQQEFSNYLQSCMSKTNPRNSLQLNSIRTNLYQFMRQLKAKTAENNMLSDYRDYLQLIHTDTIQQFMQWNNYTNC